MPSHSEPWRGYDTEGEGLPLPHPAGLDSSAAFSGVGDV